MPETNDVNRQATVSSVLLSAVRAALARYNCPPGLFLSAFVLVLASYAYQAIVPAFNADDVIQVQSPEDARSVLVKLRWGYVLVYGILLGYNPAPLFTTLLGTFLLVVSGYVAAAIIGIRSQMAAFAFVLISSVSVYYGDLFGFDSTRLVYPVGNVLAVYGLRLILSGSPASGIALAAAGACFYSASVELAAAILVGATIGRLTRDAWRPVLRDFLMAAAALLAALVILFVGSKVMFWLLGLTFALENVDYFNANAVVERFNEVVSIIQYHALPVLAVAPHAYLPVTVAFCVTALFIFHLVHSTALAYRRSGPANAILVVAFSAGLLLTPFFLLFANTSAIFSARSLFAYSAIHGLWAATLLDHYGARPFSDRAARLAAIVALSMSALVVISSAAQISKRAYEEYLVSQSDLMITNRIISRIETLLAETPGAPASPIPIAVVFERHVVGGPIGGLGSARSFPWSREWIFRLLDRRFEWVTGERYIGAREAAMTHGDWPAKDSVFLHEGIVVVVINKQ